METNLLSTKRVEEILRKTLGALEEGKSEMYQVAENARSECNRVRADLDQLQMDMLQAIRDVERLEQNFQKSRVHLYQVSRDYDKYSEDEKRQVYQKAEHTREGLAVARERERNLRGRRDSMERVFQRMEKIAEKAERLVSQVGVALNYLAGNIQDVTDQIENVQAQYQIGQGILKGQEDERKRMAREMHDGPAQDMANLSVKLDICEKLYEAGKHDEAMAEVRSIKGVVQSTMKEVRRLIHDLSPMTLEDLGLVHTVKRLIAEVNEQTGIASDVRVVGEETRLEPTLEFALYRTIQEAVNNSKKHGHPAEILVRIEFMPQKVSVAVFDDGVGFDIEEVKQRIKTGKHYGLFGMEDRIRLLNGTFRIHSAPGQGTRVVVGLPVRLGDAGGIMSE